MKRHQTRTAEARAAAARKAYAAKRHDLAVTWTGEVACSLCGYLRKDLGARGSLTVSELVALQAQHRRQVR